MKKRRFGALALLAAGLCLALSSCGTVVDEEILNSQANTSVDIQMPYATATPLPDNMNAPDAIVIDSDGNVTLNDRSVIEGDFQSARDQEQQTEYRSLSLGNTGIAVQALQLRLKELGYFTGDVSGVFDSQTENAVRRFEQTYGTMQTGAATAKLQLKLFSASAPAYGTQEYNDAVVSQYTVLRPGTVGSSVYALQQRLKNLGYPITSLTGVFDDQTAECVRLFYAAYGLAASDVANVAMQKELYADTALVYDPTVSVMVTLPPEGAGIPEGIIPEGDEDAGASAIALGNSGTRVMQIQRRLIELGYMPAGSDTGVFDEATQDGVNRFLSAVGRAGNGMLTLDMQEFLLSDRAPEFGGASAAANYQNLNPGDSGEAVMNLQRRLVELGYANGTPNGEYGRATISAVAFYQQCNGLEPDGLASAWLQSVMFSEDALSYAQTQQAAAGTDGDEGAAEDVPAETGDTLYFNLTAGATGSAVIELQNRLVELGYLDSPSTIYDEDTQRAVAAFQRTIGVPIDGDASASLQRYIYSKAAPGPSVRFYSKTQNFTALKPGDSGDAVTVLQKRLWQLGFLKREDIADSVGVYNEATRLAVVSAQLKMGYTSSDGIAGIEFQSFLYSKYGSALK